MTLNRVAKNDRLKAQLAPAMVQAQAQCQASGQPARVFADVGYRTHKSWSRERRVVGKAEHLPAGPNPRFVVTSLPADRVPAQPLYEDLYCARGDMENRIKEQQLALFADRTSSATLRANQLRLYWSTLAYVLLHALRSRALAGTPARPRTMRHLTPPATEGRRPYPCHRTLCLGRVDRLPA